MTPQLWLMFGALAVCIALSAFFSASETAYSSFNRLRLKSMAAEGNTRAKLALRLSDDYDRLLTTILIGNNIVNILPVEKDEKITIEKNRRLIWH